MTTAPTVTLHLGDCLDVLKALPDGSVDAVVTDPPYGLGDTQARRRPFKWQRLGGQVPREWDRVPGHVANLLDLGPKVAIWGGNYFALPPSRGWLVWYKPDALPSMASAELCWTSLDQNTRHLRHSISATNRERVGHPTQKPVAVMRWSLECLGLPPGSTILDPFMGSGTTGVAAVQLGMSFIGVEIDPTYHAIAKKRIDAALADRASMLPLAEVGT